jgi:hypothetical protein
MRTKLALSLLGVLAVARGLVGCGALVGIANVQLTDGAAPPGADGGGPATPADSAVDSTASEGDATSGGKDVASEDAASEDVATPPPSDSGADADACASGSCGCGFPGLLAYFTFEGNTDDSSGNGNNATATGVSYVGGKLGAQAVSVGTGANISLSSAANAGFTFTGGGGDAAAIVARTICAWVQPPTGDSGAAALPIFTAGNPYTSNASGISPADLFALQPPGAANACFTGPLTVFIDRWGQGGCLPGPGMLPVGAWGQVCFVETENGYSVAVNGSLQSGGFNPPGNPYTWTLGSILIGSNPYTASTTTGADFLGAIDEVSIWDRALTATELGALYNGGSGCACR